MAQETQTGALNQPRGVDWGGRWEGASKGRGYIYTYGWFMLSFDRKQQNFVKQLSFNRKKQIRINQTELCQHAHCTRTWEKGKYLGGFPGGSVVKNPPAKAGDERDESSIPGLGRSPGGGMATHSSILAWSIPWTEEAGGLQSIGS